MEDFVKLVKEHSRVHPAREMSFKDLKDGLFSEVDNGNINVSYHPEFPHLAIFKYSLNCVFERNWNVFTIMARGLILDLQAEVVVATPFIKFWNYNEIVQADNFIESDFSVLEKVDGSLGIMYNYSDRWMISTAGGFSSEQALWAMKWMRSYMPLDKIDKTNTYLFEIVYPTNKIVVQYDYEGLVLLGIIDKYGLNYDVKTLGLEASYLGTRCVKTYDFSDMNSILKKAETLPLNEEGYVILFKSGVRLKVKGDEYVRVHKIISNATPLAIWESMLNCVDIDEIKKEMPEEMRKDVDTICSILSVKLDDFIEEVKDITETFKNKSDRDLGMLLQQHPESFTKCKFPSSKNYIFSMRNGHFEDKFFDKKSSLRSNVFKAFKPKSNYLEGYTPSSSMNRFNDNV